MTAPVVVVGVGALGSHFVLLARNWEAPLRVVDFDRVERKNLAAQLHTRMGLGRNKAQALQQLLRGLYGTGIESLPRRLEPGNVAQLLGDAALVVDCTDNAAARRLIQGFVRERKIPCLHGALAADGGFGRVVWDEHFAVDDEDELGQATCEGGAQLPFFAFVAATLALAAQGFLATGARSSYQLSPGVVTRLA